jgi:hypothetical protein
MLAMLDFISVSLFDFWLMFRILYFRLELIEDLPGTEAFDGYRWGRGSRNILLAVPSVCLHRNLKITQTSPSQIPDGRHDSSRKTLALYVVDTRSIHVGCFIALKVDLEAIAFMRYYMTMYPQLFYCD